MIAPLIETEVVKDSAHGLLTNPWLWADVFLAMLVAAFFASLYWAATKVLPKWEAQQEATRKARAEQHAADLKARAEKEAADRLLTERWVTGAVASAADTAKHSVEAAHKEIGERVADVKDQVAGVHETARQIQRQLAGIAAKTGAPMVVLVLILFFGGGSPAQTPRYVRARHSERVVAVSAAPVAPVAPVELARVGTGEPGVTPAPGRTAPGPVKKDCDPRTCRPPSQCRNGECQGAAKKAGPTKLAGQVGPSSFSVRAAWQDSCPEAFPERRSDELWLSQQL